MKRNVLETAFDKVVEKEIQQSKQSMKELMKAVGKKGEIEIGNLKVKVKVLDVKQSYGRSRYLVTPVSGSRETWVEQIVLEAKK